MNPERWQKLDKLFHSALEHEPAERPAFLDEACGGDADLRRKLDALLAAHAEAGSFIESGAVAIEAKQLAAEQQKPQADNAIIGQTISHYRIIRRLGAGAMGEVYLAHDITLRRQVALKILPAHFTDDAERLRRFEQEARAASALNHPNILTIYEISNVDSIRYIVTEFIDGVTLREFMQSRPVPISAALKVAMQVAGALAAAHAKGIVHRDIKPENIMISSSQMLEGESNVKVLDFGIAKLTEAEAQETDLPTRPLVGTRDGMTMGTTPYMSPEQARAEQVDARTDIWSLGVVLYEMVAGHAPFTGATRSHVIVSILEKEPLPLRQVSEVPEALEWIVNKALRKDKEERYQTAREFHGDLRDIRRKLAEANRQPHLSESTAAVADPRSHEETDRASLSQPVESVRVPAYGKRRVIVAASVALIVLIGAVVLGKYVWPKLVTGKSAPPYSNFKMNRLTTTGRASAAVISPDGKYVVHVKEVAGQYSLWIKHIATGSDKEIVSADGSQIESLSFSPDGNFIYFIKKAQTITLNEIPVLGGPVKHLVTDIDTAVTLSPDGKRFAFIRGDPSHHEASLIIANSDGTGETKLVTHPMADLFPARQTPTAPSWSADGETIAFAHANSSAQDRYVNLSIVGVRDRRETQLTFEKWAAMEAICWLPDGTGLLLTASEELKENTQVWYASNPSGKARQITRDPNNYRNVTVTADGASLVTVLSEGVSDIWVAPDGDSARATQVTTSRFDGVAGLAWTPDGRIVHVSRASGNPDIWIMNADGAEDRQLTFNTGANVFPTVTPDGHYILFNSNRTGTLEIWRMDVDGKNQKQLTYGESDASPGPSNDSKWVIFTGGGEKGRSLWKVPIDGGSPTQFSDSNGGAAAISPKDGSVLYTFVDQEAQAFKVGLMKAEGGPRLKVFDIPQFSGTIGPGRYSQYVRWTPDGNAAAFIDNKDGVGNLWAEPIAGGPRKQLTSFKTDLIFYYAWSADGKKLALARGSKTSDVVLISDLGSSPR